MKKEEKFSKKKLSYYFKKASLDDTLRAKEYKVLLFLLPELRKGKSAPLNQAKIARELGLKPSQVSKAISRLKDRNIIDVNNSDTHPKKIVAFKDVLLKDLERDVELKISINTGYYFDDDDDDDNDED